MCLRGWGSQPKVYNQQLVERNRYLQEVVIYRGIRIMSNYDIRIQRYLILIFTDRDIHKVPLSTGTSTHDQTTTTHRNYAECGWIILSRVLIESGDAFTVHQRRDT